VTPPTPLVRLRLKYPDVDTFVEKFAPNVTRGGIFLASREPRPVGAVVRFEVGLLSGAPLLSGEGRVSWVKEFNPAEPTRPHGMGVQFTGVDPACRPVLERILKRREAAGRRPTVSVPTASVAAVAPLQRPTSDSRPTVQLGSSEFDAVEDSALRRLVDRARVLTSRTEDVEELLKPDSGEQPATLAEALAEIPRYVAGRRGSGLIRLPSEPPVSEGRKPGGGSGESQG
jgi:uncharacterized protein (TIGR02266 family)